VTSRLLQGSALAGILIAIAAGCGSGKPQTLHGSVSAKGIASLTDEAGRAVTKLKHGSYTLVLNDRSRSRAFNIAGPSVTLSTSVAGTSTLTYHVKLEQGTYTYWASPNGGAKKTLTVS
jgi:hypothetical protein